MRSLVAGLASAALLAALGPTGSADARTRPPCSARHAKVLLSTRALVVYSRVNRGDPYRTRTVYACARRARRTRPIGSVERLDTETTDTTIRAHARTYLVVDTSFDDQYAHSAKTTWWNIASGRRSTLYSLDAPLAATPITTGVALDRTLLSSDGCTLLSHSTDRAANAATVLTAAFSAPLAELDRGTADAIPPASLVLSGRTASWTNAGVQRHADLAPVRC